jgi:hypothetical protein
MGGFAHTGVADATVRTQYGTAAQVQDNTFQYLTSVAGTNVITATAPVGMTAYATGQRFTFIAAGANTGATTLNLNSIGAKAITKNGTTPLVASDIASGQAIEVVYDGTQFQLINVSSLTGVSSFSAGSTGLTPSTATTGAITLAGTLAIANGGTNNASLAVTAGGVLYTDGSKVVNVGAGTAGQSLVSNGSSAPSWGGGYAGLSTVIFAASGTWTVPTGITKAIITVIGAGGGAGGTSSATAGGAGGGGGYAEAFVTGLSGSITITVGTGGTGGAIGIGTNGTAGGTSSFGALVSAAGGGGGVAANLGGGAGTNGSGTVSSGTTLRISTATTTNELINTKIKGTPIQNSVGGSTAWTTSLIFMPGAGGFASATGVGGSQAFGGVNGAVVIQY